MRDLLSYPRAPQLVTFDHRSEKVGLTVEGPVPWNADAVLVRAQVRLPGAANRRRGEFAVRVGQSVRGGQSLVEQPASAAPRASTWPAESFERDDVADLWRLGFRLPVPTRTTTVELLWRQRSLGQMTLRVQSRADFLRQLALETPTLWVNLDGRLVACQTYVASQCQGLVAGVRLGHSAALVPLCDLDLQVAVAPRHGEGGCAVPLVMTPAQLCDTQAMAAVALPFTRRPGTWQISWMLGEVPRAMLEVRAVSKPFFTRSLEIADARFVVQRASGEVELTRQVPDLSAAARLGPCFVLRSRVAGIAGWCTLQVRARVPGATQPPPLREEQILVTDHPTPFAPGTMPCADLTQVEGFELRLRNRVLGTLPLTAVPSASFTGEGGYRAPPDFAWSPIADDQLKHRLGQLLDGCG